MDSRLNGCGTDMYLDPVVHRCMSCKILCLERFRTATECQQHCPEYYSRMVATTCSQRNDNSDAPTTSTSDWNMAATYVLCAALVVLGSLIIVVVVTYGASKLTNSCLTLCSSASHRTTQQHTVSVKKGAHQSEKQVPDESRMKAICMEKRHSVQNSDCKRMVAVKRWNCLKNIIRGCSRFRRTGHRNYHRDAESGGDLSKSQVKRSHLEDRVHHTPFLEGQIVCVACSSASTPMIVDAASCSIECTEICETNVVSMSNLTVTGHHNGTDMVHPRELLQSTVPPVAMDVVYQETKPLCLLQDEDKHQSFKSDFQNEIHTPDIVIETRDEHRNASLEGTFPKYRLQDPDSGYSTRPPVDLRCTTEASPTSVVNDNHPGTESTEESLVTQYNFSVHDESKMPSQEIPDTPSAQADISNDSDRWNNIMQLYKLVENLLVQFKWIVGCMLSNDALEVIVETNDSVSTTVLAHTLLCEKLPPELHKYLEITQEYPSLELCCTKFGTGCTLRELDEDGIPTRCATTTLIGNTEGGILVSYAFSVGHVCKKHKICDVECLCTLGRKHNRGSCLAVVDTVTGANLSRIRHKLYDMSLVRMNHVVSQSNGRCIFMDQCINVKVVVEKNIAIDFTRRDVLIFGGPARKTFRGKVDIKRDCAIRDEGKFVLNMYEIVSSNHDRPLVIQPGHSGSLVTLCPDANNVARAFAYVVGCKPKHNEIAIALPLWENISKVCESEEAYRHLLKDLRFADFDSEESGYISVCSDTLTNQYDIEL